MELNSMIPMHSNKPYTAPDHDVQKIARAYAYLSRENPLWLAGLPGISPRTAKETRRRQLKGEDWRFLFSAPNVILFAVEIGQRSRAV
jgi:hypothetical protein